MSKIYLIYNCFFSIENRQVADFGIQRHQCTSDRCQIVENAQIHEYISQKTNHRMCQELEINEKEYVFRTKLK